MSHRVKPARAGAAPSRYAGFEAIRLQVTVRVGRAVCRLSQLAHLEQGQVLVLDRRIGEPFELRAGDVLLGYVEPVADKDAVAVKLVRVAEDDDDDAC